MRLSSCTLTHHLEETEGCRTQRTQSSQLTDRVFLIYLPLRLYGLASASPDINDFALSVLSCESALLFPRLAFTLMKKNVLVM